MKTYTFLLLSFITILCSCEKDNPDPNAPTNSKYLTIVPAIEKLKKADIY